MKQKLAALNSLRAADDGRALSAANQNPTPNIMNKQKMIETLNKWGVKIPENATDEQLVELVAAGKPIENKVTPPPATSPAPQATNIIDLQKKVEDLENSLGEARRIRITNRVEALIVEDKLPAALKDKAIARAVKDESYLDELASLPSRPPGADPLENSIQATSGLEVTASIKDIARGFEAHNEATKAWQRGQVIPMETLRNQAVAKANFFKKFKNRFIEVMNTNTIPAGLKRQVILQDIIVDFARKVLNLDMFSTVYRNVPLEGTNKVEVPFYDLDTAGSQSFADVTGYNTIGDTTTDVREVEIGKGAANGDRLYIGLGFTSEELARQPYLKIAQLAKLKAEKLASDIVADILSVVTAANYGAAAYVGAAAGFDSDDIADLVLSCKLWPEDGRGLLVDTSLHVNLLKDPSFKSALNAASDAAIKEGRLNPRVLGFDYKENPTIPANGENLVGFAFFKSAILCAFAPVPPAEEVRNAGCTYEMLVDPASGAVLEYRTFGDPTLDSATHILESSYGFAKGNGNALKRLVTAA
jgi:hypothetical protein